MRMKPSETVGKNISVLLRQYGVDTVFGIPGVHNIEMFRGAEELGINFILPRHEQGAAFMADGFARASGQPGVCFSISGPGVTNSLTALGQSYSDSVSILMGCVAKLVEIGGRRNLRVNKNHPTGGWHRHRRSRHDKEYSNIDIRATGQ